MPISIEVPISDDDFINLLAPVSPIGVALFKLWRQQVADFTQLQAEIDAYKADQQKRESAQDASVQAAVTDSGNASTTASAANALSQQNAKDIAALAKLVESLVTTPKAAFTANPTSGPAPLLVAFTDTSTGATSWDWDFGDGSAHDTTQNPTHGYSAAGTFTVTLSVNSGASTSTATITVS